MTERERIMGKINRQALFVEESEGFRIPLEPKAGDRVKLRFRTAKDNVESVYFISGKERNPMTKVCSAAVSYTHLPGGRLRRPGRPGAWSDPLRGRPQRAVYRGRPSDLTGSPFFRPAGFRD